MALYLNLDMVASLNPGYFVMDGDASDSNSRPLVLRGRIFLTHLARHGSGHIEKLFTDYFKTVGMQVQSSAQDGWSDSRAFGLAVVPMGSNAQIQTVEQAALLGGTPDERFDSCYHKVCDDVSNLNVTSWVLNTKAAAHAIATYVNPLEGIPRPRPTASSIHRQSEALLKGVSGIFINIVEDITLTVSDRYL